MDVSQSATQAILAVLTDAPQTEAPPAEAATGVLTGGSLIAVLVLVFGAVALGLLYHYLHAWKTATTDLAGAAHRQGGHFPLYRHVQGAVSVKPLDGAAGEQDAETLVIDGPLVVAIRRESAEFRVLRGEQPVPAQWRVDGEQAEVTAPAGTRTRVVAQESGPLTVVATVQGEEASATITALPKLPGQDESSPGSVPLVGEGYGAFTIAILAVSVAGALTALEVLPGAALATLLGTVISYVFIQGVGQERSERATNGDRDAAELD
jgi:hypothetical protein